MDHIFEMQSISSQDGSIQLGQLPVSDLILNRWFQDLLHGVEWEQHRVSVFNRIHLVPRLTAFYGDAGVGYTYAGFRHQAKAWSACLLELKKLAEQAAGVNFNSVLLNHYRNGSDRMGWHADNEPELGRDPIIVSVSLGASRYFDLKHRTRADLKLRINLRHGSLLMMGGATQHHWLHQVPAQKRITEPRINLTFRTIQ